MSGNYLYIDGGALRAAVASVSVQLVREDVLLPCYDAIRQGFDKVFYYDAVSAQLHDESVADYERRIQAEHNKFDFIRSIDRYHVSLGEIKGQGKNRRQKQVDVRLAVDMLTHAFHRNMQNVTLFAGDDDFIPVVEALVRQGLNVTIWHPPQASEALLGAADNRRLFNIQTGFSYLSRDGRSSAFVLQASGGGSAPKSPSFQWDDLIYSYVGIWEPEVLSVWRSRDSLDWEFRALKCVGSPLAEALAVFSLIFDWNFSPIAVQRISDSWLSAQVS